MIRRLDLPSDLDGREIGSLVTREGNQLSCVDVSDTTPTTWGILLADMLRQAATSFEMEGLTLDGRLLTCADIESAIKRVLDDEFASPTSKIDQVRDAQNEN